ncbi:MAG TPA: GDYXXLXY domain-containing protein [Gammaproteobacteria bacterium]|nr:GDYXXLXY domain-containing protein [Gammaproteobacteria bacterium]
MRTLAIILAIVAQAAALGWVVLERETVLRSGSVVYLRTAPVDPRDVFRGDYVRLSYDINRISRALADATLREQKDREAVRVYASLAVDANGIASVTALRTQPPAEGLYLRGYTSHNWQLQASDQEIAVKFGIEKLFVEQGAGLAIEERRGTRDGWQTPMEVAVTVGDNGIGVIREHRWASIATRLEVLNPPQDAARNNLPSPQLRFSIRNDANTPLALVNPGNDCGLSLWPVDGQAFAMLTDECSDVVANATDVVTLAPGEIYAREIDTADPRWHIRMTDDTKQTYSGELGKLNGWQRFRLIYRSPVNAEALSSAATPVWIGTLSSAAFSNRGRVD